MPDTCLIWSNEHRGWWGPEECGYVKKVRDAGRYSLERATAIVRRAEVGRGNMADQTPPELVVREVDAVNTLQW